MKRLFLFVFVALVCGLGLSAFAQDHDTKVSPFDGIRWVDAQPEVQIEKAWYAPVAIDGHTIEDVLAFCDRRWPGQREKRFAEDLVEVLVALDWKGDLRVDLDLRALEGGADVRLEGVEMTKAKRNALRDSGRGARPRRPSTPAVVPVEDALADVDAFEAGLRDQFAYVGLGDVDLEHELDRVRASLTGPEADVATLGRELHRVLMRFGDGHAGVRTGLPSGRPGDRYLPFLLVEAAEGVVAIQPDRSALVEPKAPYVRAIDGRALEEWIDATRPDLARGSPQYVRRFALRGLREVDERRRALGLESGRLLRVTFSKVDGSDKVERELETSQRRPTYGPWPRSESRVLEGDIGYLRIAQMNDEVGALREAMEEFVETKGLIVDVRGNGGGTRELLLALGGYLIGPDEPAVVGNIAQYRRSPRFDEDHLVARYMYRADWDGWNDRQRKAIADARKAFEPEWKPVGEFSQWHCLVLDRTGHPAEYFYDRDVVVLADAGCFSATDIFLGAVELLPRVTLLGAASSGGSARTQSFRLPKTGIEVRCASMASFRPGGWLYDGRGIEVDIEVLPAPEDFLRRGGDTQLEAALEQF